MTEGSVIPVRMLLLFFCLATLPAWFGGLVPASGWEWDFINGIGFAAVGAVAYLGWDSQTAASLPSQRLHSNIAIAAALLVVMHAAGFLLLDSYTVEYLKLKAPLYMLAGLAGALVIVFLAITSLPRLRRRVFSRYSLFRSRHTVLSIAVLALTVWHVLGADYYLPTWYAKTSFVLIAGGAPLFGYVTRRRGPPRRLTRVVSPHDADLLSLTGFLGAILLALVFSTLRNV